MIEKDGFPQLLKLALIGDAVASGATGLMMAAAAGFLAALLGLPEWLLWYAGLFLIPYALFVAYVGTRSAVFRSAVRTVIFANLAWVLASLGIMLAGVFNLTGWGYFFVIGQALVVLGFAVAQWLGLGRVAGVAHAADGRALRQS